MMDPVAVVTARAGSERLKRKNMLPLEGFPIAEHSIIQARAAGLRTIVTTDIPELADIARKRGCMIVHRPPELADVKADHGDVITHAMEPFGLLDRPCVLLQPTSPFRSGGIIEKCIKAYCGNTVLTVQHVHGRRINGDNDGDLVLWDGCVAIFPPGKVCNYDSVTPVENEWANGLQIDRPEDYEKACTLAAMLGPVPFAVAEPSATQVRNAIRNAGLTGEVTLVARSNGKPIPQDNPVVWLNHCQGWDGQRADALLIIANPHIRRFGPSKEAREVARKAKLVIVRDNGEGDWLHHFMPEICGKSVSIRHISGDWVNGVTTGGIASSLLTSAGCKVTRIGFSDNIRRATDAIGQFAFSGVSREIAILRTCGEDHQP